MHQTHAVSVGILRPSCWTAQRSEREILTAKPSRLDLAAEDAPSRDMRTLPRISSCNASDKRKNTKDLAKAKYPESINGESLLPEVCAGSHPVAFDSKPGFQELLSLRNMKQGPRLTI